MEKMMISEDNKFFIKEWKEKNNRVLAEEIDEKNFERIFARIHSFRNIVLLIDKEFEESKQLSDWESIKVKTPTGSIEVEVETTKKIHKLIDRWDKLDDLRLNSSTIKDLEIKFFDMIRLKYANYMGFIYSIIDSDYVIYETD